MPIWLIDLLARSPVFAVVALVAYFLYGIACRIVNSPLSMATMMAVLAGQKRREDARKLVEILCHQANVSPMSGEVSHPIAARVRHRGRRHRRRNRRPG